ncbi:MAG: hypothetical protein ACO1RX_19225 [Candidatus Sericytochromatia bacterium]
MRPASFCLSLLLLGVVSTPALSQTESPGQVIEPAAPVKPVCEKINNCIQMALNSSDPVDRVMAATRGITLWTKSYPERDLLNLLAIRAEALIQIHMLGQSPQLDLLGQAEADYRRFFDLQKYNATPLSGLARIDELRGEHDKAILHHRLAVEQGQPPAMAERAGYFHRLREHDKAWQDLEAVRLRVAELKELGQRFPPQQLAQWHMLRADVLRALDRRDEAQAELDQACSLGYKDACPAPPPAPIVPDEAPVSEAAAEPTAEAAPSPAAPSPEASPAQPATP